MKALSFTIRPRASRAETAAGTAAAPRTGDRAMEGTLYGFILAHSLWQQIFVLLLTLVSFPFLYYSLDLPKTIVNVFTKGAGMHEFSLGVASFPLEQVPYLMALCGLYLLLVLINGGFKYWINRYKGQLGERMLRRLRYELYSRLLRFPLHHFKKVSPGEIIPMITSEVEPLGGFIGDAFALPAFQGGTLLTIILFMFMQDPILGLASIALYPIQGYVIPKLQRKVNLLGKARVRTIRRVADRLNESIHASADIHSHDNARFQLASFAHLLGTIYDIRFEIYQRKFFVKFLNNTLNAVTPFFFFSIGGYLVIRGQLSAGVVVAMLAAYKDLSSPWKELLDYYQSFQDTRIKYEQVIEQFQPTGMFDERLMLAEPETIPPFTGEISLASVTLVEDDRVRVLDSVTTNLPLDRPVAIVGQSGSGKQELALLIARLVAPSLGRVSIAGQDLATLPEAAIGRRMGYVGAMPYLFTQSLGDNLTASLKHVPLRAPDYDAARLKKLRRWTREAALAGNIDYDINADWIDYQAAGVEDRAELTERVVDVLRLVDLDHDVYMLGLRGSFDPASRPDAAAALLEARKALHARLTAENLTHLVEPFDAGRYNTNASVAENLLFGTPIGPAFDIGGLSTNTYVLQVLDKAGLTDTLVARGAKVAETMVEIFADGAPSDEFVSQFSFIGADELPEYQAILARMGKGEHRDLRAEDRARLLALPFKLVVSRHRLGLVDEELQERILQARRIFAENLPPALQGSIAFFGEDRYNAAASLLDNILFGKIAYGEADAETRLTAAVSEVIDTLGLRRTVIEAGLDFPVGPGGSRLSPGQRAKVAIARAVLKRPDVLVLNEATTALDGAAQAKLIQGLKQEFEGRGLIWVLHRVSLARQFQEVVVMSGGRLVAQGPLAELDKPGTHLTMLMMAE
ncbi:MAG TPA: ABC transporter transmembrane domain-containing protein [Stellaceae bacterium]|nr:ABC transporter transmembrane domain-containing protein [Stellaceae bacterium]